VSGLCSSRRGGRPKFCPRCKKLWDLQYLTDIIHVPRWTPCFFLLDLVHALRPTLAVRKTARVHRFGSDPEPGAEMPPPSLAPSRILLTSVHTALTGYASRSPGGRTAIKTYFSLANARLFSSDPPGAGFTQSPTIAKKPFRPRKGPSGASPHRFLNSATSYGNALLLATTQRRHWHRPNSGSCLNVGFKSSHTAMRDNAYMEPGTIMHHASTCKSVRGCSP
jgi:hypothetical protein